jgi:hypothetical protein
MNTNLNSLITIIRFHFGLLGSVLYESLADRIHPIGRTKNDVKYSDFYTYLSCLQVNKSFSLKITLQFIFKNSNSFKSILKLFFF